MWRVLGCKKRVSLIPAVLCQRNDLRVQRRRFDGYRLHVKAPKWERQLSSAKDGLVVGVNIPGSRFEHDQALPPCSDWKARYPARRRA